MPSVLLLRTSLAKNLNADMNGDVITTGTILLLTLNLASESSIC